jgi:hypothetical protein
MSTRVTTDTSHPAWQWLVKKFPVTTDGWAIVQSK